MCGVYMGYFVFTKMGADGGQTLEAILARREFERQTGNGVFWWAIGNSLGLAVHQKAREAGGALPVLFSRILSRSNSRDTDPYEIFRWSEWQDSSGAIHKVPKHIFLWSRGIDRKKKQKHYALVCRSDEPVTLGDHGPFDPARCWTHLGKRPGTSQVTALLRDESSSDHAPRKYRHGFRASLVHPWFVTLVNPRPMTQSERDDLRTWPQDSSGWKSFKPQLDA